jgi:kynurenine formamidase
MKLRPLIAGYALVVALLLFAQQRHSQAVPSAGFRAVVDLTHTLGPKTPNFELSAKPAFQAKTVATIEKDKYFARVICLPEHFGTHLDAPAHFARGMWTVEQIPAERLVAPLAVVDVSGKAAANPDYQLSVEDIAAWEHSHGPIPQGAVVIMRSGWSSRWSSVKAYRNADGKGVMHFPGYSLEAAQFLVEGRRVIGLGIDTLSVDYGPSTDFPVHQYTLPHSIYHLENVANLEHVPATGAVVVVAPMKLEGGSGSPVRILALLK